MPCGVALTTEGAHPNPLKRHQAGWLEKGKMLRMKNLNGLKLEEEGLVGQQWACEKNPDPSFGTADAINHPRVGVLVPAYNSSIGEAKIQKVL